MKREDCILEWTYVSHKQSETLKTSVENVSELILIEKLRLCQFAGID